MGARSAAEDVRATRDAILEHGRDSISAAKLTAWERLSDRQLVGGTLSSACYIDDAFPAALALAWRHAGDFTAGVVANARCGGDNCHRAAVVGSLLAASAPIPQPLVKGLAAAASVTASQIEPGQWTRRGVSPVHARPVSVGRESQR